MTIHHEYHEEPVVHQERAVVREPGSSLAGYALVKYAFILAITIVILFFIAKYLLPRF